jgi:histidinol-phosphate/aromatic aminotransferase/cobyric acid decarboxylase-like protein
VRNRSSHKITRNCLRITVGNESQNKILIKNLKEIK